MNILVANLFHVLRYRLFRFEGTGNVAGQGGYERVTDYGRRSTVA
jgi:hypothetical protein